MSIKNKLELINQNISRLKEKLNINYDINLIAISKNKPITDVIKAINADQLIFGENKVQEAISKIPQINNGNVKWHFIGCLQKNKVKKAVELFDVIHSIDKLSTALEVNKRAKAINKIMPIFIQVNTTEEKQKLGIYPPQLEEFIKEIRDLPSIKIIGLMTISAFTEDYNRIRQSFRLLRSLRDKANSHIDSIKYLSMGMTNDYEIAIEEGASHIRLGTSIFGERIKPNNF